MISHVRIFVVLLAVAAYAVPAQADDELLKTQPFPTEPAPGASRRIEPRPSLPHHAQPPPETARPARPQAAAPQRSEIPGMMGLPWPKSPEEVAKTIDNLNALMATSGDHRQAGEISAAIERLWQLQGGDTVNLLIARADEFASRNEGERALPLLDAAVDLAPDYAEAWSHRAYVEYRLSNYQAALGDLRRALAINPNHFRALDGMAKILVQLGEKKAALEAYDQLLKIHPNIEGGQNARDALKKEIDGQGI